MQENKKELQVAAIQNGTVIDHIPSERLFSVVSILKLAEMPNNITIGFNLESKKIGKKGIVKIADKYFEEEELNKISLIAPHAHINIIKDYKIIEKKSINMPHELVGIVKCNNPKCITNNEPMKTRFTLIDEEQGILKCHYCEKEQNKEDVVIL